MRCRSRPRVVTNRAGRSVSVCAARFYRYRKDRISQKACIRQRPLAVYCNSRVNIARVLAQGKIKFRESRRAWTMNKLAWRV